mmetsp:Transcript_18417/g.45225  ORF Transcript_18417/g.45225 Transcript_18417/m.45225 type:complete len:437 (+) Transcript_18417:1123-2433(+)
MSEREHLCKELVGLLKHLALAQRLDGVVVCCCVPRDSVDGHFLEHIQRLRAVCAPRTREEQHVVCHLVSHDTCNHHVYAQVINRLQIPLLRCSRHESGVSDDIWLYSCERALLQHLSRTLCLPHTQQRLHSRRVPCLRVLVASLHLSDQRVRARRVPQPRSSVKRRDIRPRIGRKALGRELPKDLESLSVPPLGNHQAHQVVGVAHCWLPILGEEPLPANFLGLAEPLKALEHPLRGTCLAVDPSLVLQVVSGPDPGGVLELCRLRWVARGVGVLLDTLLAAPHWPDLPEVLVHIVILHLELVGLGLGHVLCPQVDVAHTRLPLNERITPEHIPLGSCTPSPFLPSSTLSPGGCALGAARCGFPSPLVRVLPCACPAPLGVLMHNELPGSRDVRACDGARQGQHAPPHRLRSLPQHERAAKFQFTQVNLGGPVNPF